MFMSFQQNEGQNHDIKINNIPSENVAMFATLGATLIHKNVFIKKLRSSCLLPKTYIYIYVYIKV